MVRSFFPLEGYKNSTSLKHNVRLYRQPARKWGYISSTEFSRGALKDAFVVTNAGIGGAEKTLSIVEDH